MIRARLAETKNDVRLCLRIRWTVFVEEQGVRPSMELDDHDHQGAVHALATDGEVPCGAARFVWAEPGVAKIERMAVIDGARGRGAGRELLKCLETEASRRGAKTFTLHAQTHARRFYEKAGYRVVGREFDDGTGIPHVRMDKPAGAH
ncbi:MAG TPA: GNAT family N-acetyltransferase [Myxococcales bacterium]|nr:GNAT family N-acetyltransferase [Myxococcales bacterium]